MFSAKKNKIASANSALKNRNKTPFIQPEMKVIKPVKEKTEEVATKAKEVTQEAIPKKAEKAKAFFPAKKSNTTNTAENKKSKGKKEADKENKEEAKTDKLTEVASKVKEAKVPTKGGTGDIILPNVKTPKSAQASGVKAVKKVGSIEKNQKGEDKGKEKDTKEEAKKEIVAEAKIPRAPKKPEDDPAFQKQIKQTENIKEEKSKHPEAETKVGEQKEAGHPSVAVQTAKNDQLAHAEVMAATSEKEKKREPFKPETFKEKLKSNLKELEKNLPKDSDSAKEFKKNKPIKKMQKNISGQVTSESDKLAGPLKTEANKPAPSSGQPTTEAKPLPPADAGKTPKPLNAKAAIPKQKMAQEISMEKESQSLDDYMADNKVTDEQLAKSNEPKFTGALAEKNNAQTEAKLAPVNYRKKENSQLKGAQKVAATNSKEGLGQMQAAKLLSEKNVLAGQTTNKTNDKTEKEKIYAEFKTIYEETKKTVTEKLEKLSTDVDDKFKNEAEKAQKTFEKNVEDGLGEIYGWTVIDDWIFGEDTDAIDKLFRVEKNKFTSTMDGVLDDISEIIAKGLNGALDAIEAGKKKSKKKFDNLSESEKKLGESAFKEFNDQYAELEDTVYEKQDELAKDLAKSYQENVAALDEKFNEIKDKVSAGWIGAAFNALAGVIKTILKIKDMLVNLLSAAVSAIGAIISDPIGFLSNLIQGVKQGFVDFGTNIKKHMIKGVIEWLTGSLGNVGITLPKNLFSLSGIFSLVTQMLGLTWEYFRSKAVKIVGEPVVAGMEKAVEVFQIVRKDGIKGLWKYIKEQFNNLKEMVMDAIRDMIITKVIEAGIKWVMGLLSPAGAFVKAAMMIIDIVKFFVERAAQIFELVNAFIKSIKALAAGNVKAVAKGIEMALAKAIPVLIGFLAALVGVTGLTGKIQKIIKKVRKKIDKAIDKIIRKASKTFRKILGKKKPKKGDAKKIKKDNKKQKPDKITAKDKAKHKKIAKKIKKKLEAKPKKKTKNFKEFYALKKKEAKSLEDKYQSQLKKGINLDIKSGSLSDEQKDGDIDFKIKIYPNTHTEDVTSEEEGNSVDKIHEKVKADFTTNAHPKIKKSLEKSLESALKADKKVKEKDGRKGIQAYGNEALTTGLVKELDEKNPINTKIKSKTNPYTAHIRSMIWDQLKTHQKDKVEGLTLKSPKAATEIDVVIDDIIKKAALLKKVNQVRFFQNKEGELKQEIGKLVQKDTHNNFNPTEMTLSELGSGNYLIEYDSKDSTGKPGPKFKIDLNFFEVVKGLYVQQERKVQGTSLRIKDDSVKGRGEWDSGENGFHNAHILADQMGGPGKNYAANIHPSSPNYNTRDMKSVEDKLAAYYKRRDSLKTNDKEFNVTVTATLTDEKSNPNHLKQELEKEFNKDNKKNDKGQKEIKTDAKNKMIDKLQKAITKDMKGTPAQFEKVVYAAKGLDSKYKTQNNNNANADNVLDLNNVSQGTKDYKNTERTSEIEKDGGKVNQTLTIGKDHGYKDIVNKDKVFDKNQEVEKLKKLNK